MRESFQITLYDKDGAEIKGTVKRPTIDLSSAMQELSVKLQFQREERKALYLASDEINRDVALAEVGIGEGVFADARKKRDELLKSLTAKDKTISDLLIKQFQLIVNVSKGDAKDAPKVAWNDTPVETIGEAVSFFLTGKLPSETIAPS
jgi:hypothetical protein